MSQGTSVSWNTSMGTSQGVTISTETTDGYILVALSSVDNTISPVFYIKASILTKV